MTTASDTTRSALPQPLLFEGTGVRQVLVLTAAFTLPFTEALTLDLRFPLKIYELALLAALASYLLDFHLRLPPRILRDLRYVSGFVLLVAVFFLVRLLIPAQGLLTSGFESRFGPVGDGAAKLAYLGLAAFAFGMFAAQAYHHERALVRCWIMGALLASFYSWYLFGSSLLGHDPFLLPGMADPQRFTFGPLSVIRSGTFEEGNFLGLYLLISVGVAAYARRWIAAILLSLTVIISFSTINVLGLMMFWAVILWKRRNAVVWWRRLLYGSGIALFVLCVVAALLVSGYIESVLVGKLGAGDSGSRQDRLDLIMAGLRMFLAHPVIGVGISQFGYYYDAFRHLDLPSFFHPAKVIPNNVYIELLSELGVLGFSYFAIWLVRIYRHSRAEELTELRIAFLATLFVLNAFPSYSVMFLWAFFGLIAGLSSRSRNATPLGIAQQPQPA